MLSHLAPSSLAPGRTAVRSAIAAPAAASVPAVAPSPSPGPAALAACFAPKAQPAPFPYARPGRFAAVGVGGAGVGAILRLREAAPEGLRFVALDTSGQVLNLARARAAQDTSLPALHTLLLAEGTEGLGTGGDASLAAAAARAAAAAVLEAVGDAEVVLLAGGLGGGTGAGATPQLARMLRDAGCVVIGFGIMPFGFESAPRQERAEAALGRLRAACDSCLALDNDRLLASAAAGESLDVALRVADDLIRQAAAGLVALASCQAWLRLDLPTAGELLAEGGDACLALGLGRGPQPAGRAMRAALASPLTDMNSLRQARSVLVQVTGDAGLAVHDVADAVGILKALLPAGCEIMAGVAEDPTLRGSAQVMLLGLGLPGPVRLRQPLRGAAPVGRLQLLPRSLHLDLERGAYSFDPPQRRVG